ncbi:MAG TPA: hypothetical protein VFD82_21085 [Planctomycetota bacterium]|nr:hypothetical protein [Planctomycetota bacterium]
MRCPLSAFLLSTLLGSFATAQTTWIVDDNPGPGVHFTSLPAAVAAAASGDTLLIAPGNYQPFHAMNKSLTILGSGSLTTIIDGPPIIGMILDYLTITAPPAGATFRLSGVTIRQDLLTAVSGTPIFTTRLSTIAAGPAGPVELTDVICEPATTTGSSGGNGLKVTGIAVYASRCVFRGGWYAQPGGQNHFGAAGVAVNGSGLFVADACVLGGGSPVVSLGLPQILFATGGHALAVIDSTAHLTRTGLTGGAAMAPAGWSNTQGGAGLVAQGFANVRAYGSVADSIAGGAAGDAVNSFGGPGISAVSPATVALFGPIAVAGGAGLGGGTSGQATTGTGQIQLGLPARPVVTLTGSAPSGGDLDATLPVTLGLAAPALGPQLFTLFIDLHPGYTALPGLSAEPFLLTGSAALLLVGLLDAAGQYAVSFVPAIHTPEWTNLPLHLQAFGFDPATGTWLGSNAEIRRFR